MALLMCGIRGGHAAAKAVLDKGTNPAQAMENYRKILMFSAHNPPNAFARTFAKKKLE